MDSPTLHPSMPTASIQLRRSPYAGLARWPSTSRRRWLVRLALATPLALAAWLAWYNGYQDSANQDLAVRSQVLDWGSADLAFIDRGYPPLPLGIASLVGGSTLALGLIGAGLGGIMLHALVERLVQWGYSWYAVIGITASLGATISFPLAATTDLASFMALTFCVLAINAVIRFVQQGETIGGFHAGLYVGLAAACAPFAFGFAIGLVGAAPLLAHRSLRGQPQAERAVAALLALPTASAFLGWSFLQWRFTGSWFDWVSTAVPDVPLTNGWAGVEQAWDAVWLPVLLAPLLVVNLVHLARTAFPVSCGLAVLPLGIFACNLLGLAVSQVEAALILGATGVLSLPRKPARQVLLFLLAAAVAQFASRWVVGLTIADLGDWVNAVV